MGSLLEELARREAAARERVERLRERLTAEEETLSRLVVTRQTVEEILGEAASRAQRPQIGAGEGPDEHGTAGGDRPAGPGASLIGVVTVPRWRPGMNTSVLPRAYQDVLEVLADTGSGMRAGKIVAAVGLPAEAVKVEGMRSKLKRLVERGWLREDAPGLFSVTEQVAAGDITGSSPAR
ncbi:hypothetical protein [Streptosporangium sp. NBC_01756]|uniref:hypothetical protein n=1 Tax=Streptosporangium sp. NBC_01756 TaxID=2975950 RepID=UPI002DDBBC0C|nr:hypothetical protein [Streptosporangium sp. NBC_01756]WSC86932.1 hypothetical protein OIE48_01530 [Streptosporangium sp. NBC_01756]